MFRIGRQSVYTIMAPIARISQSYPMPLSWRRRGGDFRISPASCVPVPFRRSSTSDFRP